MLRYVGLGDRVTDGTRHGSVTHVYRDHLLVAMVYVRWDGRDKAYPRPAAGLAASRVPAPTRPSPLKGW